MSTFRGCESHDFCICHYSVTLPLLFKNKKSNPFFDFLKQPREKEEGSCVFEASGLWAESVGVGCQRAPIARIRYPVWTSHQVYSADLHDNTWKQE